MLCIFLAAVEHGNSRSISSIVCTVKTPIENRQLPNDLVLSLGCNMFVILLDLVVSQKNSQNHLQHIFGILTTSYLFWNCFKNVLYNWKLGFSYFNGQLISFMSVWIRIVFTSISDTCIGLTGQILYSQSQWNVPRIKRK